MKLYLKAVVVASLISLSGCGWFGANQVEQIRTYTVEICSYLPTVASVTAIVAAQNVAVAGAFQIAAAICEAVTKSRVSEADTNPMVMLVQDTQAPQAPMTQTAPTEKECPKVNNVCVEGTFVDEKGKPSEAPKEEKK